MNNKEADSRQNQRRAEHHHAFSRLPTPMHADFPQNDKQEESSAESAEDQLTKYEAPDTLSGKRDEIDIQSERNRQLDQAERNKKQCPVHEPEIRQRRLHETADVSCQKAISDKRGLDGGMKQSDTEPGRGKIGGAGNKDSKHRHGD